jgi:Cu-Zn family superoxide dismutase
MKTVSIIVLTLIAAVAAAWLLDLKGQAAHPAATKDSAGATVELKDAQGSKVGEASLRPSPNGVLFDVTLTGATAGDHALHIHQTGRCDPPDFKSAGGHFRPAGKEHGFLDPNGPHAGDLPNLHVPPGGRLEVEVLADHVTLDEGANALLDSDGAALVMHAKADDYRTDPAGAAGDRVACGVIEAAPVSARSKTD